MLRFGILGAARIAPTALIEPAKDIDTVTITRVAARDRARASAFARAHGIPHVDDTYEDLVAAEDVDVVYNPLPMSLHAEWTIRALRAGKHVLCEKPLASNADEAAEMVRVAAEEGLVLGEAFHYRYHPLFRRVLDLVHEGRIGDLVRMEGAFDIAIPQPDIRWDYATSGGATMDLGCYPVHQVRTIAGEEPDVVSARAVEGPPAVDASMAAELRFPSGATARIHAAMDDPSGRIELTVTGTAGTLHVVNPVGPHNGNTLTITTEGGTTRGTVHGGTTYHHMLRSFVDYVVHGTGFPTTGDDAIANMAAIDAIYEAAGLPRRGLG